MREVGIKGRALLVLIAVSLSFIVSRAELFNNGGVVAEYEILADGGIRLKYIKNNTDKKIRIFIDSNLSDPIKAGGSHQYNQCIKSKLEYGDGKTTPIRIWPKRISQQSTPKPEPVIEVAQAVDDSSVESVPSPRPASAEKPRATVVQEEVVRVVPESVDYYEMLDADSFFGNKAVARYVSQIDTLCAGLSGAANKQEYVEGRDLNKLLAQWEQELEHNRRIIGAKAEELVIGSGVSSANQSLVVNHIVETLTSRLRTREEAYKKLKALVAQVEPESVEEPQQGSNIVNYCIVVLIIVIILALVVMVIKRRNKQVKKTMPAAVQPSAPAHASEADNQSIVVRRRTTSILKKQCIDDVVGNGAYMVIDTAEFTPDSAVRNIYIKNTCIREVYNLYAEDLRNVDNPKEDGCMVLGRWVLDEASGRYDVSLEEVVLPGDDAVFKEYELNFGGKIKLRIAERLRKLRRETNLQYDLVCWIHSHPGLGVFFSNSDDNVQMQLKHSQHPNFLVAFVVDILTSDQETGIFTFRSDGSMNSKGDIVKMYSLEEMYQWALQSERKPFTPENYYNVLGSAKLKMPTCKGVELDNSSIIDLTQIVIEPDTGIVGWAVGSTAEVKGTQEFVVSNIVRGSARPAGCVIGCLISATYMSLPTIQRLVAGESASLSFVMVYSSKQSSLTTIPVLNGELLTDEQFYGDVTIDDLKIWTRRKR